MRHYLRSMASAPELAPNDQNHLLRTTSVIRHIDYSPSSIRYKKFDARSVERLKLGAGTAKSIQGGTMQWDASQKLLTVQASSHDIVISLRP